MVAVQLQLVVPGLAMLDAAAHGAAALAALLGCDVAAGWEVFDGAVAATRTAVANDPASTRWGTRFFLVDEPGSVRRTV